MKLTEIKQDELIIFENRIYRVNKKPFSITESDEYGKKRNKKGLRLMLILLKQDELNEIIIKEQEIKKQREEQLKGGFENGTSTTEQAKQ